MNIFQDGQPIDLETVLANKDWRTAFQTQLEKHYPDDV
ncbi:citrate lyase holo-[acyl-carrier protein] synthase, partial [Pseudomonas stutzeri]|nr:citrate lyase holo-[acyl-carrier protein] synthase [Stutzerimonas stutzeri]